MQLRYIRSDRLAQRRRAQVVGVEGVARIERRRAAAAQLAALKADMEAMDARAVMKAIELGELRDRMYALEAEKRRVSA